MLDNRKLAERLERETYKKVFASFEQLKSIKFNEIVWEARRAREDATKNMLLKSMASLAHATNATNKQVEKTSRQVEKTNESVKGN